MLEKRQHRMSLVQTDNDLRRKTRKLSGGQAELRAECVGVMHVNMRAQTIDKR